MKVKSIRDHNNTYGVTEGAPVVKKEGVEYDLPESMAKTLIDAKLVEEVKAKAEKAGDKA
jgi:hypothetical protein